MNFIKKIFENKTDDSVHDQFVRFSIGDYYPRAVLQVKSGATTKFKSGFEFGNDFIKFITENVKGDIEVSGKIFAKKDFDSALVKDKVKKKGFYVGTIKQTISTSNFSKFYKEIEQAYLLLNIKGKDFSLKIKQAPHNPRGKYKEDFCKFDIKGDLAKVATKEFLFDVESSFKQAIVKHRFLIDNVEVPKEFEKDLAMARLMARRIGKVIRELAIDDKESSKEAKFKA